MSQPIPYKTIEQWECLTEYRRSLRLEEADEKEEEDD